jgi:chromosome segregation ATPase
MTALEKLDEVVKTIKEYSCDCCSPVEKAQCGKTRGCSVLLALATLDELREEINKAEKEVAVNKKAAVDFESALDELNDRYQQLSLNYDIRVEDKDKLQAALDKATKRYEDENYESAMWEAAYDYYYNEATQQKERADKAEKALLTAIQKVNHAEKRVKELEDGVHEIAEEVFGCAAPCSLDIRAKCKELEARQKK